MMKFHARCLAAVAAILLFSAFFSWANTASASSATFSQPLIDILRERPNQRTAHPQEAQTGEAAFYGRYLGPHQVALLENGPAAFAARLEMIEAAQSEIDIETFIFEPDESGRIVLLELLNKKLRMRQAKKPFRVRLLIDRLSYHPGAPGLDLYTVQELRRQGIEVKFFNEGYLPWTANYRSHKKIFLIDGKEFITGGRNIQNLYFGFGATHSASSFNYLDTDIFVQGPAASGAQGAFDAFWDSPLSGIPARPAANREAELKAQIFLSASLQLNQVFNYINKNCFPPLNQVRAYPATDVTFLSDKPGDSSANRRTMFGVLSLLSQARQNAIGENWTFLSTDDEKQLLRGLLARHVQLDLVTNSFRSNDGSSVFYLSYSEQVEFAREGMHIYAYSGRPTDHPGLDPQQNLDTRWGTHAKVLCVDASSCYIGSANFDPRSENINAETGVIVNHNLAFSMVVLRALAERLQDSFPMTPEGQYLTSRSAAADGRAIQYEGPTADEEAHLHGLIHFLLELTRPWQ